MPLPLAWMDKDMRGERPGQADAGEGMQPRQREVRGLLRKIEDRVLPRLRLGRDCSRGVHGHARRLPQMVQGCQDKGRSGLQEPHAVPQGLGPAGSVGWIRSRITTAVPFGQGKRSCNVSLAALQLRLSSEAAIALTYIWGCCII